MISSLMYGMLLLLSNLCECALAFATWPVETAMQGFTALGMPRGVFLHRVACLSQVVMLVLGAMRFYKSKMWYLTIDIVTSVVLNYRGYKASFTGFALRWFFRCCEITVVVFVSVVVLVGLWELVVRVRARLAARAAATPPPVPTVVEVAPTSETPMAAPEQPEPAPPVVEPEIECSCRSARFRHLERHAAHANAHVDGTYPRVGQVVGEPYAIPWCWFMDPPVTGVTPPAFPGLVVPEDNCIVCASVVCDVCRVRSIVSRHAVDEELLAFAIGQCTLNVRDTRFWRELKMRLHAKVATRKWSELRSALEVNRVIVAVTEYNCDAEIISQLQRGSPAMHATAQFLRGEAGTNLPHR